MTTAAIEAIDAELRRGEPLGAYDLARARLEASETAPRLRYLAVLALARAGASAKAAADYRRLGLHREPDIDCASLWARIRKDLAAGAAPARRSHLYARAAAAYAAVHRRTGAYFPGINAATLAMLAGDRPAAEAVAHTLLDDPALIAPDGYYAAATRAEALVLLRRWDEAIRALGEARRWAGDDVGAVSTTRRQVGALLDALDPPDGVRLAALEALRLSRVALLTGPELPLSEERPLKAGAAAILAEEDVGFAVTALWTSGSLLLAEQVLARDAELHLVLPFSADDVLARTDDPARRRYCLDRAATVTFATTDGDFADPKLVEYAAIIASGLAETRARRLSTEAVWVDIAAEPASSEIADGLRRRTLAASASLPPRRPPDVPDEPARELRAFLFADVFRFSTIAESRLPDFWARFMTGLAATVDAAGDAVLYRNTWGDALFLVLADITAAADLALSLQERAATMRAGDRATPELRIGLHHGPVFRGWDAIRGVPSYFGTQVSRAARVEPIAPPGAVFVTEPFAAILAATGTRRFEAEYVGRVPLAKKYGEHRMYRLARRWDTSET